MAQNLTLLVKDINIRRPYSKSQWKTGPWVYLIPIALFHRHIAAENTINIHSSLYFLLLFDPFPVNYNILIIWVKALCRWQSCSHEQIWAILIYGYTEPTVPAVAGSGPMREFLSICWLELWLSCVQGLTDGPGRSHLLLCHSFGIAFHTFQHFSACPPNFCPLIAERRRGGGQQCAQSLLVSLKWGPAGPRQKCCVPTLTAKC